MTRVDDRLEVRRETWAVDEGERLAQTLVLGRAACG